MSELITRRTFLKATGAAALAVAASGMLAGCGEGYGATPGNPTLPAIDTGTYATFGNTYVDMGPLTGTWVSRTTYESDGWRHNYLYTGLSIDNTYNTTTSVTIHTSNFTCKHNGATESGLKVCSLDNFGLNRAGTGFQYVSSVTVARGDRKTFPIYIDLGPVNTTSLNVRGIFTVELKLGGKTVTFKYQPIYEDPSIE